MSRSTSPESVVRKRRCADEAYGRAPKKVKNGQNEHEIWCDKVLLHGKTFVRNANMWTRPEFVIDAGLQALLEDSDSEDGDPIQLTPEQERTRKRHIRSYQKLKLIYRDLEKDIAKDNESDNGMLSAMEKFLRAGQQSARATDTSTVKLGLPSYHNFSPPINLVSKQGRGYHNQQTGRLLCPLHLSWDNPDHVERLKQGLEDVASDVFYHFMYEGNQGDSENAFQGLLRGPILVKAYRAIFFGPGSVGEESMSEIRATKAGNAMLGGISSVSPSAIAYVTTLVRFALSSDSIMTSGDRFKFNHCGFYRSIVDLLEPEEPSAFRKKFTRELLRWWNEHCFPDAAPPVNQSKTSS
ncbi:hypothetical protein FRC02_012390 [Tulasnella sp. 418]|nr:hypothetical protein FRC02_012390 [Tulasnella sp. 418]